MEPEQVNLRAADGSEDISMYERRKNSLKSQNNFRGESFVAVEEKEKFAARCLQVSRSALNTMSLTLTAPEQSPN